MRVASLWRYPVKSLGGEQLDVADVLSTGLDGDRRWGIVDEDTGHVLTARREPRLLFASARLASPEAVRVELPDGSVAADDEALSAWLERPVRLERAGDEGGTYENPLDAEGETGWMAWQGPGQAWHDSTRARLTLVSTVTLGAWDVRRFRPNVVLDGVGGEDELVGDDVQLGACRVHVTKRVDRCVMVTRPQPGLERDLDVLRTVTRDRESCLAIGALVRSPGSVRVGDPVEVC